MNCNEIQYRLADYLSGKLSREEALTVAVHLEMCQTCQAETEQLGGLIEEMKHAVSWSPSHSYFASLLPRIHQRIEEKKPKGLPDWSTRFALPLAGAIVVAVVILNIAPRTILSNETDLNAVLQQLQPSELQDAVEHQLSVDILESSSTEQINASPSEDKEVLKTIFQEEDKPYVYTESPEFGSLSSFENISDRDADELTTILERKGTTD